MISPIEQTIEALRPFASAAEFAERDEPETDSLFSSSARHKITLADLFRAAEALAALEATQTQKGGDENTRKPAIPAGLGPEDNALPALGDAVARALQEIAELPDRTSPDDAPDMLMATESELQAIITSAIAQAVAETWRDAAAVALNPGFIQACDTEWDEGVNYAKRFIHDAICARGKPTGRP